LEDLFSEENTCAESGGKLCCPHSRSTENENKQVIAGVKAENIPFWALDSFSDKQTSVKFGM